jgi:hypothetical protein
LHFFKKQFINKLVVILVDDNWILYMCIKHFNV